MTTTIERTVNRHGETRCAIGSKFGEITVSRHFSGDGETLKPATVNWFGALSENNERLSWFIAAMRSAQAEASVMDAGIFKAQPTTQIEL